MHLFGYQSEGRMHLHFPVGIRITMVFGALVLLVAPLPLAASASAASPAPYSITDLGTLGSGNLSVANAINNAGVVVGYTQVTPGLPIIEDGVAVPRARAPRDRPCGPRDLRRLPRAAPRPERCLGPRR